MQQQEIETPSQETTTTPNEQVQINRETFAFSTDINQLLSAFAVFLEILTIEL